MLENFYYNELFSYNASYAEKYKKSLIEKGLNNKLGEIYLNLGCGQDVLEGFINVDKYQKDPKIHNYDFFKLPYEDNSVDLIYCCHALEHLPIRHAKLAIKEWSRVLKNKTGFLYLEIPDLEIILHKLLDNTISNDLYDWLIYTLFGFQTNPSNIDKEKLDYPVDYGQFHCSGFTKTRILEQLKNDNLKVTQIFNYDGCGTPSIWLEAFKDE
jgi:hypothetical protein